MKLLARLIVSLFLFCSVLNSASAVTFEAMMNTIVRGTPGVTNLAITGGVRTSATAAVDIAAGSLTIPVTTTVAADVSTAAVVAGAGRIALRAVPWVGTAIVLGEIATAVKNQSGYVTCDAPNYFCKAGTSTTTTSTVAGSIYYNQGNSDGSSSGVHSDAADTCIAFAASRTAIHASTDGYVYKCMGSVEWVPGKTSPTDTYYWYNKAGTLVSSYTASWSDMGAYIVCPDGKQQAFTLAGTCTVTTTTAGDPVALTSDEVNAALSKAANADGDWARRMKIDMDSVANQNLDLDPPVDVKAMPVTVTAPAVTSNPVTVSTSTIQNADGTTSTQTVSQTTTVTPSITSGGTVSSPGVTYPSTTTTTTSVTNNTTNVTSTTSNTTNNTTVVPSTTSTTIPTDYNREVTQKAILQQLDGSLITVADPADQEARTKTEVAATDKSLADTFSGLPGQLATDKANWFSWVWTPPVGTCAPSMFQGTVHGYDVSFDICPWVEKIRDVIGWLFAIFGALNIYSNLFKKGDE